VAEFCSRDRENEDGRSCCPLPLADGRNLIIQPLSHRPHGDLLPATGSLSNHRVRDL
jgi:hypothetical protein